MWRTLSDRDPANPYFRFTDRCNDGGSATLILSSGQACVWYRLALASKDGDWLIREDASALQRVIDVLACCRARYRLGAPLALPWLAAGWSSHFEATSPEGLRLRFDFVSRPPRLDPERLAAAWARVDAGAPPVVEVDDLIVLKRTMRLKDYAFVGALSARLADPAMQIATTIDAGHLLDLLNEHPALIHRLPTLRPALVGRHGDVDQMQAVIDAEVRAQRRADEIRMSAYARALVPWAAHFRTLALPDDDLHRAHEQVCAAAQDRLPTRIPAGQP